MNTAILREILALPIITEDVEIIISDDTATFMRKEEMILQYNESKRCLIVPFDKVPEFKESLASTTYSPEIITPVLGKLEEATTVKEDVVEPAITEVKIG